jgi:hypothetical protein
MFSLSPIFLPQCESWLKQIFAPLQRAKTNCELQRELLSSQILLEARKGVRADYSVRPLGTAAMRRVPYPLIPETRRTKCHPRWAVPELVGFLLHPISRSETWRRLKQLHANFGQTLLARSEKSGPNSLGERVDQEEPTANRQLENYT